ASSRKKSGHATKPIANLGLYSACIAGSSATLPCHRTGIRAADDRAIQLAHGGEGAPYRRPDGMVTFHERRAQEAHHDPTTLILCWVEPGVYMGFDTLIVNGTVITATDTYNADVAIMDGRIAAIAQALPRDGATRIIDAKRKYVMPGGIDVHTHLDMPFGGT